MTIRYQGDLCIMRRSPIRALLLLGGFVVLFRAIPVLSDNLGPLRQESLADHRIFAYRDWQSVGVRIDAGDQVEIRAKGTWSYTPNEYHGPEGHARYPAPAYYPLSNLHGSSRAVTGGGLLGKIGANGRIFAVGKHVSTLAAMPGTLYLRINDDILSDNDGWVQVKVSIKSPRK